MIDHALEYARRGWHVFPLHSPIDDVCTCAMADCDSPVKHPRTTNGIKDATTDQGVIIEYWTRWPESNIGIRTGQISGIVVLDVDSGKGGLESWAELQDINGRVETLTCRTGGGGLHMFFVAPVDELKSTSSHIAPGIDTRAEGSYIVAPPSLHMSGQRYWWDEEEL